MTTLYRGRPAVLVDGARIGWLGDASDAPAAEEVVDLDGAWIAPGFVDAHLHTTSYGAALTGLDLTGVPSRLALLDAVERVARTSRGRPVIGTGWDETAWPDKRLPTRAELDRASYGGVVYLARVDVHSAVVSSALLELVRSVRSDDGLVTLADHHNCRRVAYAALTTDQRRTAQLATLRYAVANGVACVQEMAGPDISGEADLAALLDLAASDPGLPEVIGYWADLGDVDTPLRLGLPGGAGDLFVDGTIGSRTAALRAPYADARTKGHLRYGGGQVTDHVIACAEAGLQAGFHAIGDAALDAVVDGFEEAGEQLGTDRVRAGRHRIEHAEMADERHIEVIARLGIVTSVQPVFDELWGGPHGMYAERLGAERAAPMNPFAGFAAAGVPLALGSDAPVTPIDPWRWMRAAVNHRTPGVGLDPAAAFAAATTGGWRAARVDDGSGTFAVGAPATFAVWATGGLDAAVAEPPDCLATVVRGRLAFAREGVLS